MGATITAARRPSFDTSNGSVSNQHRGQADTTAHPRALFAQPARFRRRIR
jgi:hypothetical protein